jgi:hypothetical protein
MLITQGGIIIKKSQNLPRSAFVSLALSSGAALVGAVLVAFFASKNDGTSAVFNAFGTTLLTIGIVSFASEHLLRKALTRDLLSKIGLRDRLHNAGLDEIVTWTRYPCEGVFSASQTNTVVALRPASIVERLWPEIETSAGFSPVTFNIYFPDPESRSFEPLAARLAIDPHAYRTQVETAFEDLKKKWTRAAEVKQNLNPKSKIAIHYVGEDLGHSLIASEGSFVLLVEPFNPSDGSDEPMAFRFRRRDELSVRAVWIQDSLNDLVQRKLIPIWGRSGAPARVKPTGEI